LADIGLYSHFSVQIFSNKSFRHNLTTSLQNIAINAAITLTFDVLPTPSSFDQIRELCSPWTPTTSKPQNITADISKSILATFKAYPLTLIGIALTGSITNLDILIKLPIASITFTVKVDCFTVLQNIGVETTFTKTPELLFPTSNPHCECCSAYFKREYI
jgi:hypothetical protein